MGKRKKTEPGAKLWEKGYRLNREIESFTVGNDNILDQKLVKYDCIASMAHAEMLGKLGILTEDEVKSLKKELNNIIVIDKNGDFRISIEEEDCHTAIENHLIKEI